MPFTRQRNAASFRSLVPLYTACATACVYLVTACSESTAPTSGPDFVATRTTASYPYPAPVPDVAAGPGSVTVTGVFVTPTPCYNLSATNRVSGKTLTIRVAAQSTLHANEACVAALQAFNYTATSRVAAGAVDVVVVQNVGSSAGTVVLDKSITVP